MFALRSSQRSCYKYLVCGSEYLIEAYKENHILLVPQCCDFDVYSTHDVFKDFAEDVSVTTA